jgi:hypothetical protein
MNEPLRPLNLGEILDRTFQIYRAKFVTFVAIAAAPALVIIALEAVNRFWWGLTPYPYSGDLSLTIMQWTVYSAALYQVALLLHLLVWPACTYLVSQLYLGDRPRLTAAAFRGNTGWRGWFWTATSIWGAALILPEVAITALFIAFYYVLSEVMKVSDSTQEWLMPRVLYGVFALGFVVFFWLSSAFFFMIQLRSLEGLTVRKAMRRSWTLSKGSRLKTSLVRFASVLTAWLVNLLVSVLLVLFLRLIVRNLGVWLHYYRNLYTGIGFFAAFTASTLIGPICPIAFTLFYYDQRIRREGYDIERMMESAGLNAPLIPPAADGLTASGLEEAQP